MIGKAETLCYEVRNMNDCIKMDSHRRNEPMEREVLEEQYSRPARPLTSSPTRNRYHPYLPQSIGERRSHVPNSLSETASHQARRNSEYMNALFTTPASRPVADDDASVVILGEIRHGIPGGPVRQFSAHPQPHRDFQRPISHNQPQPAPLRIENNFAHPPERAATFNAANAGNVDTTASPQSLTRKRIPLTTISPTPAPPGVQLSKDCQTGTLEPAPVTPSLTVRITSSVAIQTTYNVGSNKETNHGLNIPTKSTLREVAHSETDPLEALVSEVISSVSDEIRRRCKKNFPVENESDRKRLAKALEKAKHGIKPQRCSLREILQLFSVIEPINFPYEIKRLWNKDPKKAASMQKEEKVRLMVEDLNGIEKKLIDLGAKIKARTATEEEQADYESYSKELGKKYFKYQKFLGTECSVLTDMYATQTLKFDFSKSKMSALGGVQEAVEQSLNAERERFLKCKTDVESGLSTPTFRQIQKIVSTALKSPHFESSEDEIFETAERVYAELMKEMKYRRVNDFWRSILEKANCSSMEELERSDPANRHPALAARLESNSAVTNQRVQEFLSENNTDENNDVYADLGETLGGEETVNLEHVVQNDDDEDENDRNVSATDAVVPVDSAISFSSIFAQVQRLENGVPSSSMESSMLFLPK